MEILPQELIGFIESFRGLMRKEVFNTFSLLLTGLLVGEVKDGTVRASVFAGEGYQPSRISDFFTEHKLSPQALMAQLTGLLLRLVYPKGLPERMFWIADSTLSEKPYAEKIASMGIFHRSKWVFGRAKHLKGHCYVGAAHLSQQGLNPLGGEGGGGSGAKDGGWVSYLCGALLYVKGKSIPELVVALVKQLRLPNSIRHVWIVDRGILSRTLMQGLAEQGQYVLGRLRCNQVVYFPPQDQSLAKKTDPTKAKKGRKKVYGQKCRVDQLLKHHPNALTQQQTQLLVAGKKRTLQVYDVEVLLRGVFQGQAQKVRVIMVVVQGSKKLKPWYLLTTDLQLDPIQAVVAYAARSNIELNFSEAKDLGLEHYRGRSAKGVRRYAVLICMAHSLLKLIASGVLNPPLPSLNWPWYPREHTLGQVRRRLIEYCRPSISCPKPLDPMPNKFKNVA